MKNIKGENKTDCQILLNWYLWGESGKQDLGRKNLIPWYKSDEALVNSLGNSESNSIHLRSPTLIRSGQAIVPGGGCQLTKLNTTEWQVLLEGRSEGNNSMTIMIHFLHYMDPLFNTHLWSRCVDLSSRMEKKRQVSGTNYSRHNYNRSWGFGITAGIQSCSSNIIEIPLILSIISAGFYD